MLKKIKKSIKSGANEKGQAVFELVVFLPFLVFLFTMILTIGNSINGSINQQKATRRYFFYIYKGNSTIPAADDLEAFLSAGVQRVGISSVGWREKSDGATTSYATCYPFNTLFSSNKDDTCFDPVPDEGKTNFVRLYTFFGLCGTSYTTEGGASFVPELMPSSSSATCVLSQGLSP